MIKLKDLKVFLSCQICNEFLRKAYSSQTCSHSYCYECIIHHIKNYGLFCPKCPIQEKNRTLLIRYDKILQKLTRRIFVKQMKYINIEISWIQGNKEILYKRYFLCEQNMIILQLQKLFSLKLNLSESQILFYYQNIQLPSFCSLRFLAHKYQTVLLPVNLKITNFEKNCIQVSNEVNLAKFDDDSINFHDSNSIKKTNKYIKRLTHNLGSNKSENKTYSDSYKTIIDKSTLSNMKSNMEAEYYVSDYSHQNIINDVSLVKKNGLKNNIELNNCDMVPSSKLYCIYSNNLSGKNSFLKEAIDTNLAEEINDYMCIQKNTEKNNLCEVDKLGLGLGNNPSKNKCHINNNKIKDINDNIIYDKIKNTLYNSANYLNTLTSLGNLNENLNWLNLVANFYNLIPEQYKYLETNCLIEQLNPLYYLFTQTVDPESFLPFLLTELVNENHKLSSEINYIINYNSNNFDKNISFNSINPNNSVINRIELTREFDKTIACNNLDSTEEFISVSNNSSIFSESNFNVPELYNFFKSSSNSFSENVIFGSNNFTCGQSIDNSSNSTCQNYLKNENKYLDKALSPQSNSNLEPIIQKNRNIQVTLKKLKKSSKIRNIINQKKTNTKCNVNKKHKIRDFKNKKNIDLELSIKPIITFKHEAQSVNINKSNLKISDNSVGNHQSLNDSTNTELISYKNNLKKSLDSNVDITKVDSSDVKLHLCKDVKNNLIENHEVASSSININNLHNENNIKLNHYNHSSITGFNKNINIVAKDINKIKDHEINCKVDINNSSSKISDKLSDESISLNTAIFYDKYFKRQLKRIDNNSISPQNPKIPKTNNANYIFKSENNIKSNIKDIYMINDICMNKLDVQLNQCRESTIPLNSNLPDILINAQTKIDNSTLNNSMDSITNINIDTSKNENLDIYNIRDQSTCESIIASKSSDKSQNESCSNGVELKGKDLVANQLSKKDLSRKQILCKIKNAKLENLLKHKGKSLTVNVSNSNKQNNINTNFKFCNASEKILVPVKIIDQTQKVKLSSADNSIRISAQISKSKPTMTKHNIQHLNSHFKIINSSILKQKQEIMDHKNIEVSKDTNISHINQNKELCDKIDFRQKDPEASIVLTIEEFEKLMLPFK